MAAKLQNVAFFFRIDRAPTGEWEFPDCSAILQHYRKAGLVPVLVKWILEDGEFRGQGSVEFSSSTTPEEVSKVPPFSGGGLRRPVVLQIPQYVAEVSGCPPSLTAEFLLNHYQSLGSKAITSIRFFVDEDSFDGRCTILWGNEVYFKYAQLLRPPCAEEEGSTPLTVQFRVLQHGSEADAA
eukprot:RCo019174